MDSGVGAAKLLELDREGEGYLETGGSVQNTSMFA